MSTDPKDSFKKRQEEAKKKQKGEIPPDVDEDGKLLNPHNPEFLTKVPWYLGESGPSLKHHTTQKADHFLSLTETDELMRSKVEAKKQTARATGFRKGACKNCGAMTHKEKECVERPRSQKKAAWKSGLDIAADEVVLNLEEHGKVSYDAKRDQWTGYNTGEYTGIVVERYERLETEKRKLRLQQKEEKRQKSEEALKAKQLKREQGEEVNSSSDDFESDSDNSGNDTDEDEGLVAKDEQARDFQGRSGRQGGVGGATMKTTVRNLRLREDTPKYLRNLDMNSAHYDPKARSMRENPFPDANPEDLAYAGDNFVRHTGDALILARSEVLCWEMQARGEDIDPIANPSQALLVSKQFEEKKQNLDSEKKNKILEKYGGGEHQQVLDPRLRMGQTETLVQYSQDGRVISKGGVKQIATTKYEEDVYINNHSSVWGSFFSVKRKQWGYACCHSLIRNSYCTGEVGRTNNDSANQAIDAAQANKMMMSIKKDVPSNKPVIKREDVYGESSLAAGQTLDEEKIKAALKRDEEFRNADHTTEKDDRKRSYNSMHTVEMTPEEMEVYRMKKVNRQDPMAAFMNGDDSEEVLLEYKK